jgi:hypothetical protein
MKRLIAQLEERLVLKSEGMSSILIKTIVSNKINLIRNFEP